MANSVDTTASSSRPRYGNPTFDCGGAQVRAQSRPLATVVTITGAIDAMNVEGITEYSRHFVLPDQPIVLDLSGVERLAVQGIRFLYRIDDACRAADVGWALVASPVVTRALRTSDDESAFPLVDSVHQALRCFADVITARRRMLLPLFTKTA
ncbi:MAG: STAS domain-containing protein [Mycobacterium sp.]